MKKILIPSILSTFLFATTTHSATINYTGSAFASDLTGNPWVAGSTMYGSIDTGNGQGTSSDGFASLEGLNLNLLTWTFGDLELTSFTIPGAATPGQEVYSEGDGSVLPLEFRYDGALWATGTVFHLTIDVQNSSDIEATGFGSAQLTNPGVDAAFYNEVLAHTNGTGNISFTVDEFNPISEGHFASNGVIAAVPEPSTLQLFGLGATVIFFIGLTRRRNN